ncbi:allantoinase [Kroppenstedtia eburnea]|uniref:Allantoinase n=1 Tax=Kroppenstedtia eburnea TaxID=714067 RepID=A0A1N7IYW0_9BACL|nr:allantoinase [Kroppenstedtia eburnea]SIS42234.1 allantoinase [Kroppenstedtia eburnea]
MAGKYDLVIKGGNVVLLDEVRNLDIAVKNGMIVELAEQISGDGENVLDASGQYVLPGMIDAHVHFNEPGREDWEGFRHGSGLLAAGGCTTYFDMPLNNIPSTVDVAALLDKANRGGSESRVDFALWGALVPGNEEELEGLANHGVIGFKAFLSPTGTPEFEAVDDLTLYRGMKRIAGLNRILALHSESAPIIHCLEAEKKGTTVRDYCETRPVLAEMEAVSRALLMARETGCSLHFVHISSARTVRLIQEAKAAGLDVTLETCPHYLLFNIEDFERLGSVAKCAPPLREEAERLQLWEALVSGQIDMITSDHSPCPTSMKTAHEHDMFQAWGGITGGQFSLEAMIDQGHVERRLPLTQIARWTAIHPAKRFGLYPRKGVLSVGSDADLALVSLNQDHLITEQDLLSRYRHSPYIGRRFRCRVTATIQRGTIVYTLRDGVMEQPRGQWLQPCEAAQAEGRTIKA